MHAALFATIITTAVTVLHPAGPMIIRDITQGIVQIVTAPLQLVQPPAPPVYQAPPPLPQKRARKR